MELLDHIVMLCLIFGGAAKLFSSEATQLYIPSNSVQGFQFLHILANTGYFFYSSHLNGYKVESHCDFSLHFPNDLKISDVEHLLVCLLAICVSSVHILWIRA